MHLKYDYNFWVVEYFWKEISSYQEMLFTLGEVNIMFKASTSSESELETFISPHEDHI